MSDYPDQLKRIKAASTLNEINSIINEFPAKAVGKNGVIYSGWVGDIHSNTIAAEVADKQNLPIIDKTPRGQFLLNEQVEAAIKESAQRIFRDQGFDKASAKTAAGNFLFGDSKVPTNSVTSIENSLWGRASREFSGSLRGNITVVATSASPDRVLGRVEIDTALSPNSQVESLGGQTIKHLREINTQGGIKGVLPAIQAQFIEAAPKGIFLTPESIGSKSTHIVLSREFAISLDFDGTKYSSAADLTSSGKFVRAPITMSVAVAADEAAIAARVSAALNASPSASFKPAAPEIQTAAARGLHPNLIKGAGLAGLALSAYDAT